VFSEKKEENILKDAQKKEFLMSLKVPFIFMNVQRKHIVVTQIGYPKKCKMSLEYIYI